MAANPSDWKYTPGTPVPLPLDVEAKAFSFGTVQRFGVDGRAEYPDTDRASLQRIYRRNELVYACIAKTAQAAQDPEAIIQQKSGDDWKTVDNHPLTRLLMKPNPEMDGAAFLQAWIVSERIAGLFYAEIIRAGKNGPPVELWPLNPVKVKLLPDGTYEWRDGNEVKIIPANNMLVWRLYDPTNRWNGLAPLAVAVGSVDADNAQTDYVRAFFNNAGVPSGIYKVKNKTLTQAESDYIKQNWQARYGRRYDNQHQIAVIDQDGEYERIGSGLDQLDSESLRGMSESRICMVFNVPPMLVGALVGLKHSTYSNMREARQGFWEDTLVPMFKAYGRFLTWRLLSEYANEELIYAKRIRVFWDMSDVTALQEDQTAREERAGKAFERGGITLNEYRAALGQKPDNAGEYYLRSTRVVAQLAEEFPESAPPALPVPGMAVIEGDAEEAGKASMPRLEQKNHREQTMERMQRSYVKRLQTLFKEQEEDARRAAGQEGKDLFGLTVDDLYNADEATKTLTATVGSLQDRVGYETWKELNKQGIAGSWEESTQAARLKGNLLKRIPDMAKTMKAELQEQFDIAQREGYSLDQLLNGDAAKGYRGVAGVFEDAQKSRAAAIVRTESANTYNLASVLAYRESKQVEAVQVYDGEDDEPCKSVHDTVQTLDWAEANPLAHPNCIRSFAHILKAED